MFNRSIAYRLSVYISLAVIGVFMTFILIAYYFNSNIIKSNIENEAISLGFKAMMLGERQLVSTKEISSNISDQAYFFAQQNGVEHFVCKLMSKYPFLNAIHISIDSNVTDLEYHNYYCFRTNDSIHFQKSSELMYNCKNEKRIFAGMMAGGTPGWTEVFNCEKNRKQIVAYYSPVRVRSMDERMITIGSVLTELSLSDLIDTINSLKIGENGYAFLVSKDGTFLTHPYKDWIQNRNLFEI